MRFQTLGVCEQAEARKGTDPETRLHCIRHTLQFTGQWSGGGTFRYEFFDNFDGKKVLMRARDERMGISQVKPSRDVESSAFRGSSGLGRGAGALFAFG